MDNLISPFILNMGIDGNNTCIVFDNKRKVLESVLASNNI